MCDVCERIRMIREGTNPYFVKELETGYVVIGDFQHFRGYTIFIYKDHTVELFDLEPAVRSKHLEEMTIVAQAVRNAFGAEKMNYECLGNGKGALISIGTCSHGKPETLASSATKEKAQPGGIRWIRCTQIPKSPAKKNWKR